MTPIPKRVRDAVNDRAEGRCERCSRTGPLELHHRKFKSRGGKHTVENLVALCGWGNHTGCHGWAHTATHPLGWSVNSWGDPELTPVLTTDGISYQLHPDGTRTPLPPADAAELRALAGIGPGGGPIF